MDPILQALLSWQFIFFGLAIAAIVFVTRKFVEYGLDNCKSLSKESKFWNDLILPVYPIFLGPFLAIFLKSFPYPDGLGATGGTRTIWGLVAGLLSTVLYRVVKSLLGDKITAVVQKFIPVTNVVPVTTVTTTTTVEPTKNVTDGEQ